MTDSRAVQGYASIYEKRQRNDCGIGSQVVFVVINSLGDWWGFELECVDSNAVLDSLVDIVFINSRDFCIFEWEFFIFKLCSKYTGLSNSSLTVLGDYFEDAKWSQIILKKFSFSAPNVDYFLWSSTNKCFDVIVLIFVLKKSTAKKERINQLLNFSNAYVWKSNVDSDLTRVIYK